MLPINRHPERRELRRFTRVWLPLFVAAAGAVAWWRFDSLLPASVVWGVGGVLLIAALSSEEAARIVFVGLQTIAYPIGLLVSTAALAFLFYVVFTPMGWIMRRTGRDALRLRARGEKSHWIPYKHTDDVDRAFRQY